MANQMNVNKIRMCFSMSLDTAAKIRTYVKGRTVMSESIGGRKVRKEFRDMTVGDYIAKLVEDAMKGVHADIESLRWMGIQLKRNIGKRRKMDAKVLAGAFRKPKSEWLKPGRKPGKKYGKMNRKVKG